VSHEGARRRELAAFLRARRAAIQPADVGLPEGTGRRRTPGLRREEVAQLSGVGLTWYTWLEQSRDIPASPQIVTALANALRLDDDSRRHLYALAGLPVSDTRPEEREHVLGSIQRMVAGLEPNPAYVMDERFDILAWNRAQAALWRDPGDVAPERRNLMWLAFTDPRLSSLIVGWERTVPELVAQFRAAAGRNPGDPRYAELVRELSAVSDGFRAWWDAYPVAEFDNGLREVDHPVAGRLHLDSAHLRLVADPTLTLVLHTPVGPDDATRLRQMMAAYR
jgi:transcriptional regulator with XRE-family HTH domain